MDHMITSILLSLIFVPYQEPVAGPLTDAIVARIEKRLAEDSETSAKDRAGIVDQIRQNREAAQAQHAESVVVSGRLREKIEALLEREQIGEGVIERAVQRQTGPIREALKLLTNLVWALAALGTVGGVLYLFDLFRRK